MWPSDARKCKPCAARGNQCLEQKYGNFRHPSSRKATIKERIHKLERILGRILDVGGIVDLPPNFDLLELDDADVLNGLRLQLGTFSIDAKTNSSNCGDLSQSMTPDISINQLHGLENAPLLSLFDNAIFRHEAYDYHEEVEFKTSRGSIGAIERNNKLLRSVRSLALNAQAISHIIQESHISLCLLGRIFQDFPGLSSHSLDDTHIGLLVDQLVGAFESENIPIVTKALICLAFCIQQLPVNFTLGSLTIPAPLETLQNCYLESAESFLAPDEGIIGTIDGLECVMAEVRYYLNFGMPRKAWVLFRRAVTFAHLLREAHSSDSHLNNRQRTLWFHMWQLDRSLSLLLGLPYAITSFPYKIPNVNLEGSLMPPKMRFMFSLAMISEHIIDRNQQHDEISFSDSLQLDLDLQECSRIMPPAWWETSPDIETPEETIYETYVVQLWFYSVRNLIHLPFLLKSLTHSEYSLSVGESLASSRAIIKCYKALRDERRPVLRVCNIVDFQVFTAAMIMVLCLLGSPSYESQQREDDWRTIYSLMQVLNRVSHDNPDGVATQASHLLKSLCVFRDTSSKTNESFQAVVPYFGKMRIKRLQSFTTKPDYMSIPGEASILNTNITPKGAIDIVGIGPINDLESYFQIENFDFWSGDPPEWIDGVDICFQDGWSWDQD